MNLIHRICCAALALALMSVLPASAITQNASQATKPANSAQTPAAQTPAAAPANQTVAQRHGKPQAKTKEEFADYKTDAAIADPTAQLAAADEFAAKYPQSELRYVLYTTILQKAYGANQTDDVLKAGHKVLEIEPEDALAKIMVATVLAETTHDTDLDQDEKYTEAMKDAESAIKNIDNGLVTSPDMTPEKITGVKHQLLGMAHAAMGYIEMTRKNYALSEQHFKEAIAANPENPDATNYLRLAVSQDNLAHYADAMGNVDKALDLAQKENNEQILGIAKNEKDRLTKLMASAPKPATPPKQ